MAIKKCKECKKEVSSKAKTCPHCGIDNPGMEVSPLASGCLVLGIIAIFLGYMIGSGDDNKPSQTITAEKEDQCRKDLQCWGDKHLLGAGVYCDSDIERLALNDHKWTDGMFEPKFSKFRWADIDQGIITYIGDKIKFQNGFGAWKNYIYECDYDPIKKVSLEVRAVVGRL